MCCCCMVMCMMMCCMAAAMGARMKQEMASQIPMAEMYMGTKDTHPDAEETGSMMGNQMGEGGEIAMVPQSTTEAVTRV